MEEVSNTEVRLISEKEVARILCVSVKPARRRQSVNRGPGDFKKSPLAKYRLGVKTFLNSIPGVRGVAG